MKTFSILLLLIQVFHLSCSSQTESIIYGNDNCGHCKMTIMDKEYACELVTKKGKVYKFDDVSCMIKYLKKNQTTEVDYDFIVVNQVKAPNEFIDVRKAVFVNGKDFSSPMRGDLAAFLDLKSVESLKKKDSTIKIFTWKEAFERF